jgi:hypothetical protein
MNYLELSWPALPDYMETDLLKFCTEVPFEQSIQAVNPTAARQFTQYDAPNYLKEWVRQNIPEITEDYTIQLQIWRGTDYGQRHIDKKRYYSYNYLLMEHPGITRFFEDDGTFIESVHYEHKKWYKHIGSEKYHDVINVNNFRAAVTIYKIKEYGPPESVRPVLWQGKVIK